jgi:hypothetical protein
LVFLHIPKTGGTSLHEYLASHFEPDLVFHAMVGADVLAAAQRDFRFYSGHLYWPSVAAIPNRRVFTIIREPIGRVLSQFFYFKSFREDFLRSQSMDYLLPVKNMTLTEYLESDLYRENTENKQTRFFLDEEDISQSQEILDPDSALRRALARIDDIEAVGVFEHFEHSVKLIDRVLQLKPRSAIPRLNVTDLNHLSSDGFEKVDRVVSTKHIEMIRNKNVLDAKLHEHATTKFLSLLNLYLPELSDQASV